MGEIWNNSNRLRAIATRCDLRLRFWEQDVGGSNPLAPTKFNIAEQSDTRAWCDSPPPKSGALQPRCICHETARQFQGGIAYGVVGEMPS
jgi:hypothetical protein